MFNNDTIEGGDISNISDVISSDVDNINADSMEIYVEDCDNSEFHENFEEDENIPNPVRPLPLMLRRLQG